MSDLLNCPFCGGTDIAIFGDKPDESMLGGFNACCNNPNCQATCRHSGQRDKAIAAWNRRPDSAPVGVRVPEEKQRPYTDPLNASEAAVNTYTTGWNDCRAEVLRLNPQHGAVVDDDMMARAVFHAVNEDLTISEFEVFGLLTAALTNTDKGSDNGNV